MVNTYRPVNELPGIVTNLVIPLSAKVMWLQPPTTSEEVNQLAAERGITLVEGIDIAEVACSCVTLS